MTTRTPSALPRDPATESRQAARRLITAVLSETGAHPTVTGGDDHSWLEHVTAEVIAFVGRRIADVPLTRARPQPDARRGLSPQEWQIALLAADGLTNREIGARLHLSHRTVGSHLYRLFPKLGIRSRAQLHRALRAGSPDGAVI